jgi:phospholipase C
VDAHNYPNYPLAPTFKGADTATRTTAGKGSSCSTMEASSTTGGYFFRDVPFLATFDEWGGFFDHVPPPRVIDHTDPATVDHTGDATAPTDGRLVPDYTQLGFRVPAIVVSNLAPSSVVSGGPFEHTSTTAVSYSVVRWTASMISEVWTASARCGSSGTSRCSTSDGSAGHWA